MDTRTAQKLADLARRFEVLTLFGTIAEVDHSAKRLRVRFGDDDEANNPDEDLTALSGWLDMPADIGRNYIRWRPVRVGTQVLVACPSGNPANGVITQILYTDNLAPPTTEETKDVTEFTDGTTIIYDSATHALGVDVKGSLTAITSGTAVIHAGGALSATSGASATIDAATDLNGKAGGNAVVEAGNTATLKGGTAINLDAPVIGIGGFASASGEEMIFHKPVRFKNNVHGEQDMTCDGNNSNNHSHPEYASSGGSE